MPSSETIELIQRIKDRFNQETSSTVSIVGIPTSRQAINTGALLNLGAALLTKIASKSAGGEFHCSSAAPPIIRHKS